MNCMVGVVTSVVTVTSDMTMTSVVTVTCHGGDDRWNPCLLLIVTYFKGGEMSFAYLPWIKAILTLTSPTDINMTPRSALVCETKEVEIGMAKTMFVNSNVS